MKEAASNKPSMIQQLRKPNRQIIGKAIRAAIHAQITKMPRKAGCDKRVVP
jgi:hypothetical protein